MNDETAPYFKDLLRVYYSSAQYSRLEPDGRLKKREGVGLLIHAALDAGHQSGIDLFELFDALVSFFTVGYGKPDAVQLRFELCNFVLRRFHHVFDRLA